MFMSISVTVLGAKGIVTGFVDLNVLSLGLRETYIIGNFQLSFLFSGILVLIIMSPKGHACCSETRDHSYPIKIKVSHVFMSMYTILACILLSQFPPL